MPCPTPAIPADVLGAGSTSPLTLLNRVKHNGFFPPRHVSDLLKALVMKAGNLTLPLSDLQITSLFARRPVGGTEDGPESCLWQRP